MLDTLVQPDAILADLWRRLQAGRADPQHPFHTPAVATLEEIEGVTIRTIILRRAEIESRTLIFHTDRRSPKFARLLQDPSVAWLFYDPADRLQVRVRTIATLHTQDAVAHEQWVGSPPTSREIYRTRYAPGTPLPTLQSQPLPPAPTTDGRDNFAVVRCAVESFDWLYLHPEGHRRARFSWPEGVMKCEWLSP